MLFGGHSIGYTQQHCQADIVIETYLDEKTVKITLSNIGKVFCTTVENDDVVTDECPGLDNTAINLALVGNVKVLMKVDAFTYEIFSASNDNKGNDLFIARANDSQPSDGFIPFKGASVTVTTFDYDPCFPYWCNPGERLWSFKDTKFRYIQGDSGSAQLVFDNELQNRDVSPQNRDVSPQMGIYVIEGKRDGSNKIETMVALIDGVCMDGKKTKLRLSKKGLKSKGCAAKKAIDGFTSGVYKIMSLHSRIPSLPFGAQIPLNGVLKKTAETGTVELEFQTIASSRVYEVDPETKTVSSKSVNAYLAEVAQSISGPPTIFPAVSVLDFPVELARAFTVTMFQEEKRLGGFMTKLSRTAKGYTATVNLTFHDAKKLGENTLIQSFSINSAPIRVGERRVGENFDNIFLGGRDLRVVDFTNSTFRFANLTGAILINTFFFNAILTNATLTNANLYRAVLQLANLTDANLTDADLRIATLTNANLTRANLTRADLREANLTRADFRGANLTRADLSDANLQGANLYGLNLGGVNLSRVRNFLNANLQSANLQGVNLSGANLYRIVFPRANLSGVNFEGANLTRATFFHTNFTGANFRNANLTNADFRHTTVTNADFRGAITFGAVFTGANTGAAIV